MQYRKTLLIKDVNDFKKKALIWANKFDVACFLNNNNFSSPYNSYESIIASGKVNEINFQKSSDCFSQLKKFYDTNPRWLFGFFSYDLKNEIEKLFSNNFDFVKMPILYFFQPEYLIEVMNGEAVISSYQNDCEKISDQIYNQQIKLKDEIVRNKKVLHNRVSKQEYIENVNRIKKHIECGDVYELNYCQEFFLEDHTLSPVKCFLQLNDVSPMPMSCFYKLYDKYLLCASPERFLKKTNNVLISQPIKGTIKRGKDLNEDNTLKNELFNSEKERAENVMIVDLVRNDLSRSADPGTVKVEELYGIYSYRNLHQMISTVSAKLSPDVHIIDVIKNAFPMGSMTGAPKVKAMELIEQYETSLRGLFSGAAGYITPSGNFDFNVVIRSILYNSKEKFLSYQVGSAITYDSIAEKEYEECLLKGNFIKNMLCSH